MAPLILEGATLGQRHRHYNQLLQDATTNGNTEPAAINYDKPDIENLFNIDIACNNRDVEYILDVLKSEDMLYVTKAIKRSTWLFTDAQYAHIIDPEYLHSQLFPQMVPKASCKLLLHIRLALKDESRVEKFFQYFKDKDLKTALKWLPNCAIPLIEDIVEKHATEISRDVFKRLCERSPEVLKIFMKATKDSYQQHRYVQSAMFLLHSDPESYLEAFENYHIPYFNKKHTEIIMSKCPQRIINNFEKYVECIHTDTFARSLNTEQMKSFLLKQFKNENLTRSLDEFITYLPKSERYEFVEPFLKKYIESKPDFIRAYDYYKFAPFDVAFPILTKLMKKFNVNENTFLFKVLADSAGKDLSHVYTLLRYFRDNYMNDSHYTKAMFVIHLLHQSDVHLYDGKTWAILDNIFRSMEVYAESKHHDRMCVKAIIQYRVTHDLLVPAIIGKKLELWDMRPDEFRLKGAEREKLMNYLWHLLFSKLNKLTITSQETLEEYVKYLKHGVFLLKHWNKELVNYPKFINKIKICEKIMKEKGWKSSSPLLRLWDTKKSWKKNLFEDSLVLFPSQNVCINALKHDPELMTRHKNEVHALCCDDKVRMDRVLDKIRVYWPQTMTTAWIESYLDELHKPSGHKSVIRGLCRLLNHRQLEEFLKKYEPREPNINQQDTDDLQLNLHKNIAQSIHIARPQIELDVFLRHAKDSAQYAPTALRSLLLNLRPCGSQDYIKTLLNGEATLKKQGVHLAFVRLSTHDMIKFLGDLWKITTDPSVRAVLFHNAHKLLCKENNESLIAELWELMQTFIDSLTVEEDKATYHTFGKLLKVHCSIKPAYYMKSYRFLKSLPVKNSWKSILKKLKTEMSEFSEQLDTDFVASVIDEFGDKIVIKHNIDHHHRHDMKILTTHLLSAENGKIQTERFKKVLLPLIDKILPLWNEKTIMDDGDEDYIDIDDIDDLDDIIHLADMYDTDDSENLISLVQENFAKILQALMKLTNETFQNNKAKPSLLYRNILKKLTRALPIKDNIVLFRSLKLAAGIIDILDNHRLDPVSLQSMPSWRFWSKMQDIYSTCVPDIGKMIIKYVKEDIDAHGPMYYQPMAGAIEYVFTHIDARDCIMLKCLKYMLGEKHFIPICLLVVEALPVRLIRVQNNSCAFEDEKTKIAKEIRDMLQSHPAPVVKMHCALKCMMIDD